MPSQLPETKLGRSKILEAVFADFMSQNIFADRIQLAKFISIVPGLIWNARFSSICQSIDLLGHKIKLEEHEKKGTLVPCVSLVALIINNMNTWLNEVLNTPPSNNIRE